MDTGLYNRVSCEYSGGVLRIRIASIQDLQGGAAAAKAYKKVKAGVITWPEKAKPAGTRAAMWSSTAT
jgi:hypothetical protein